MSGQRTALEIIKDENKNKNKKDIKKGVSWVGQKFEFYLNKLNSW